MSSFFLARQDLPVPSNRCQTIVFKAAIEQLRKLTDVAAFVLTSKTFQNSSFGANFILNFSIDFDSVKVLNAVLSPQSCESLQFVPSLFVHGYGAASWIRKLSQTKYFTASLHTLHLSVTKDDTICSFFAISNKNVKWTQLRTLSFCCCPLVVDHFDDSTGETSYNQSVMEWIALTCPYLERLTIDASRHFDDDEFSNHVSKLGHLRHLELSNCTQISDEGFKNYSVAKTVKMETFDLEGIFTISSVGVIAVLKQISTTLIRLVLQDCAKISDDAVIFVTQHCAYLQSLNLASCVDLTDEGLAHISNLSSSLTELNVSSCKNLTDVALEYISSCNALSILNLNLCRRITDCGIKKLVESFTKNTLKDVDLGCCSCLTEDSVLPLLGAHSESLITLNLSRLDKLTTETVNFIQKFLLNLTSLNIYTGTPGVCEHRICDLEKVLLERRKLLGRTKKYGLARF